MTTDAQHAAPLPPVDAKQLQQRLESAIVDSREQARINSLKVTSDPHDHVAIAAIPMYHGVSVGLLTALLHANLIDVAEYKRRVAEMHDENERFLVVSE
ncbi:hypothetical protein [Pseudomonas sp. PLMAX]|uniref:hypothetical protein n=1 Tax=Pseudomonas sp. PLMAX TaxID=2201998 RepID=UPI0038BD37BD